MFRWLSCLLQFLLLFSFCLLHFEHSNLWMQYRDEVVWVQRNLWYRYVGDGTDVPSAPLGSVTADVEFASTVKFEVFCHYMVHLINCLYGTHTCIVVGVCTVMSAVQSMYCQVWCSCVDSGVGAGIDSYYEYLLKAYVMLGDETYLDRFNKVLLLYSHFIYAWIDFVCLIYLKVLNSAASKSVVYVLRKVVTVFRLMFECAAGQWSGLLWGCPRDHGMWQMHWMYYKKYYYLNTTNIFTFWHFGLYQWPSSEEVFSTLLLVLATTLIQRCITIVARLTRKLY